MGREHRPRLSGQRECHHAEPPRRRSLSVNVHGRYIGCGPLVQPEHVSHAMDQLPARVLVRVYERMPQDAFDTALPAFAPETISLLADRGVLLIGIDSASVDPADSKTLDSHQQLRKRDLRVLENLVLDDVPEGDFELIALPLKLAGACASPVRAVLREL